MKPHILSPLLIAMLVTTQILGPATLWAAEERGIRTDESRRMVIAAVSGDQLTLQKGNETKAGQFREVVNVGERLTTGDRTMAEVLIGTRAVVTLGPSTVLHIMTVSDGQAVIQLNQGLVRVAAAPSQLGPQGTVAIQTPTGQVQTRGGIMRVLVDQPRDKAEPAPTGEAKSYRASYAPERMVAAASSGSEVIQVEEGMAEIIEGGKTVTLQAGQSVALQTGKAGAIGEGVTQDRMRPGVVATLTHSQTPKEGRDYLVALQVSQATQLGKALTGAAETGSRESERKSDTKNVINGATGGITLADTNLVSALFGTGNAASPVGSRPQETTGSGYGTNRNNGFNGNASPTTTRLADQNALLVFTKMDRVEPFIKKDVIDSTSGEIKYRANDACGRVCLNDDLVVLPAETNNVTFTNIIFRQVNRPDKSQLTVAKELVLVGGTQNTGHDGLAPQEALIVRGVRSTNVSLRPVDGNLGSPGEPVFLPVVTVKTNSTFVVNSQPERGTIVSAIPNERAEVVAGGTLGRFSHLPLVTVDYGGGKVLEGQGIAIAGDTSAGGDVPDLSNGGQSAVDAAITATTAKGRPPIVLSGGVTFDQETKGTIGNTVATGNYFNPTLNPLIDPEKGELHKDDARFSGSLMAVINGPNDKGPDKVFTSVTMQDRMLGIYDGSTVSVAPCEAGQNCNKALLSVLDAKLTGPSGGIPLIDIAAGNHVDRKYVFDGDGNIVTTRDSQGNEILTVNDTVRPGSRPEVTVTSAIVTRSTVPHSTLPLDGALLEASAPLFALTQADMTTTSHFADLAGNQARSLNLGDALVALNASKLIINSGHLMNLNNATAAISGYLFSLTNGSQLDIQKGALFSLNNGSSLTLNGNAFGVFSTGANTLSIDNNMCTGVCGILVNSANQPLTLPNGTQLKVSGVTENVVLPNSFNAFALAPGATGSNTKIDIDANDALFHIDPTSTLTINGTQVQ